ncbi:hypothetical protein [Saccharopolyspora griseoalba]|uniref:Uncharacterized protein n=1 Tax=Saccharopolyspora griseoalba TaxID=1431848 RepID=A0ABW2LTM1_9PSEU
MLTEGFAQDAAHGVIQRVLRPRCARKRRAVDDFPEPDGPRSTTSRELVLPVELIADGADACSSIMGLLNRCSAVPEGTALPRSALVQIIPVDAFTASSVS